MGKYLKKSQYPLGSNGYLNFYFVNLISFSFHAINWDPMPQKSDRVVLLEEFGTIIKRLILDGKEDSEDFKEIQGI